MGQSIGKSSAIGSSAAQHQAAFFPGRRPARIGYRGNHEPALAELLIDPILHRLLQSDGIKPDTLIELIAEVKVRLARCEAIV